MRGRRALLALSAAALLAAACSKPQPPPPPAKKVAAPAPVECPHDAVFEASRAFESMHYELAIASLRIQSRPQDPADAYIQSLEDDLKAIDAMIDRAAALDTPPCLRAASELFLLYLSEGREALNLRRPTATLTRVTQVEEAAKATLERHRVELAKQQANARAAR